MTQSDVVRSFFATLSSGDLARLAEFFDDRSAWHICATGIPGAGVHTGRKGIIDEFLAPVRGMFEPGDPKVAIANLIADGDLVAVEATGRGRFLDGRVYENRYAYWIEVDGSTIRTIKEYMDSAYVASLAL